jgi:hypothetical protein
MKRASRRRSAPILMSAMILSACPSLSIARAICFGGASAVEPPEEEGGGMGVEKVATVA